MAFRAVRPGLLRNSPIGLYNQRLFSSTVRALEQPVVTPPPVIAPKVKKVGGIRGGIFGFLLGFCSAVGFASYQLLDEYRLSSAILQSSIAELQTSTQKVSAHVRRIETVEKELKALAERTAPKDDVTRLRSEMKKLYDGLHIEFLDLRSNVWGIQQDLHKLSKEYDASASK